MSDPVLEKVTAIIVDKLGVAPDEVVREASFANDLGADSLDTVELIMEFEKVFETNIPDEDAEKIVTVGDAVDYLKNSKDKGNDDKGHDHKGHDHKGHEHKGHDHKGHDHKGHDHNPSDKKH